MAGFAMGGVTAVMVVLMIVMFMAAMLVMHMAGLAMGRGLLQEIRLQADDTVEIEGAAIEHLVERHVAAGGLMDRRKRVDGTDARLDIGEFGRADQIGLVQHDYEIGRAHV